MYIVVYTQRWNTVRVVCPNIQRTPRALDRRRRRRRRRAVDTPRRAWFAADDVFRRPVLHPRGRRAREDVWVTQRYAMRCDAMRHVRLER